MKGLREKFRKNEGFTLVEMLIVVAIIAILIAISIPMVSTTLEKARHAVDDANFRDAIGLGNIEYLTNATETTVLGDYYYHVDKDSKQGSLKKDTPTGAQVAACNCDESGHKGQIIKVTIADKGVVTAEWTSSGS